MPMDDSRFIHELAVQSVMKDTIISELEGEKVILQEEKESIKIHYSDQLVAEREKNSLLSDNIEDFKSQILSYELQVEVAEKGERKARRGRNVAIGLGVVLMIVAVAR